jgi:hypothetical protein
MHESKRKEIAARAYQIWLEEGCPAGKEHEHWLRAEQELAGQSDAPQAEGKTLEPERPVDTRPAPPVKAAPPMGNADPGATPPEPAPDAPQGARPKRKSTRGRSRTPPQQG